MKKLSLIVAMTRNSCIGKDNTLPWRQREDMKFFKATTTGKAVIMGRATFDSLGQKPLPNRLNIVISNSLSKEDESGYRVAKSVDEALSLAEKEGFEVIVIGGASIYKQVMDRVTEIFVTMLDTEIDGDTFFHGLFLNDWDAEIIMSGLADHENDFTYTTHRLQRKS